MNSWRLSLPAWLAVTACYRAERGSCKFVHAMETTGVDMADGGSAYASPSPLLTTRRVGVNQGLVVIG